MKSFNILPFAVFVFLSGTVSKAGQVLPVVVFQPSHQRDTGVNYNEALTADAIVQYAMSEPPRFDEHKVSEAFIRKLPPTHTI